MEEQKSWADLKWEDANIDKIWKDEFRRLWERIWGKAWPDVNWDSGVNRVWRCGEQYGFIGGGHGAIRQRILPILDSNIQEINIKTVIRQLREPGATVHHRAHRPELASRINRLPITYVIYKPMNHPGIINFSFPMIYFCSVILHTFILLHFMDKLVLLVNLDNCH